MNAVCTSASKVSVFTSASRLVLLSNFLYVTRKPLIRPCLSGRNTSFQERLIVVDVTSLGTMSSGGDVGTKNQHYTQFRTGSKWNFVAF